jgi:hypothetical protein
MSMNLNHPLQSIRRVSCALGAALLLAAPSFGAVFTTTVTQAAGQNWGAAFWIPQGGGAAVAPSAGNTYFVNSNGVAIANLSANARIRNPTSAGVQTFPGDQLTITTNAEFRFKTGSGAINFPGVNGNPGLVMDGGVWNIADAFNPTVTGRVHIATALLYDAVNDHGGALDATRGVVIAATLSGSGRFVSFNAHTNTPIRIAATNNTFNGTWLITGGRLLGAGLNSLGTNDITIDPQAIIGLTDTLEASLKRGPAVLEVNYDINSAGTLTLANGGMMILHQNCAFNAVLIDGAPLSAGTHFYSELTANFPANFLPGGSGAITVQPYGTLPVLAPAISSQPLSKSLYAGGNLQLSVAASGAQPLTYQWQVKSGATFVNVVDANGISGAATANLNISNLDASKTGEYRVHITNSAGAKDSDSAIVSLATRAGGAYETAVLAAGPLAYYELNDTDDPSTGTALAADFVGGFNGTYGAAMQNGNPSYDIHGPVPADSLPGFTASNKGALGFNLANSFDAFNSRVNVPAWDLNTNAVTMTAWLFPNSQPASHTGIIMNRGAGTIGGMYFSTQPNSATGNFSVGYNWNDVGATFDWNSGLEVTLGQWNFVALSLTASNATLYVITTNSYKSAVNNVTNAVLSFNAPEVIGNDILNTAGLRAFDGRIDDVAVFRRSLAQSEILGLFSAASGVASFPPSINVQPIAQTAYAGQTLQLKVVASGSPAPTYQWKFKATGASSFVNVTDSANISGSTTATLTLSNLVEAASGDYQVVVANSITSVTSDTATITVQPVGPPEHITTSSYLPIGQSWDSPGVWSDGLTASQSAVAKPGSTYEVLPGARLRSPDNALDSTFPGDELTISGDGIFENNPGAGTTIGEFRFKQGASTGTVRFKKLIMNGGQLDATNPDKLIIAGHLDIRANTPIYNDTAADRGCQIDAWLTGTGDIEYHAYNFATLQSAFIQNLNITGTSNTFSGKWNVVLGILLGSAPGSLGTNDITVGAEGALETLYDINNPTGALILNGKMYLHQNDTFRAVKINGTDLAAGTYTYAQLAASYPNNFPATWTQQNGSTVSAASGSIRVTNVVVDTFITISIKIVSGGNVEITFTGGHLEESSSLSPASWTAINGASPQTITPTAAMKFYRVAQ